MRNAIPERSSRPVAIWLLVGVGMLMVQIILGGITRLTGSGLSITEWNVVTGILPPLNEQQWLTEFEKYRHSPQYSLLNFDFTLGDFKFIFFWEWFHRLWARLIGVVFAIPFIIFLLQRRFKPAMVRPLLILFLLGALQGVIGWIMVASGLTGDAVYVKPTRLALHFVFALGLLCYTFWFALQVLVTEDKRVTNKTARKLTVTILTVLGIQLLYGALMAGHKATTAAPTWPDINGSFVPAGRMRRDEGWLSLIENKILLHFIHRGLAYLLLVLVIFLTVRLYRTRGSSLFYRMRGLPLLLILLQVILGVATVLNSLKIIPNRWGLFEWLAQLHQMVAMLLLLSLVGVLYLLSGKKKIT